eukprot:761666-Hanusia_phi.AAC.1
MDRLGMQRLRAQAEATLQGKGRAMLLQRATEVGEEHNKASEVQNDEERNEVEQAEEGQDVVERLREFAELEVKGKADKNHFAGSSDVPKFGKIDRARFEAKKKKIAARYEANKKLEEIKEQEAALTGGQWVDQNWVSNMALREMGDGLVLKDWLKELATYLVLVFAFTYSLYSGRNNFEKIEMTNIFDEFVRKSVHNVSSATDIPEFLRTFGTNVQCSSCTKFWMNYTMPGKDGMILGNALVGKIEIIQNRAVPKQCSKIQASLVKLGFILNETCYSAWNLQGEASTYTKANGVVPSAANTLPFFQYRSSALGGFMGIRGTYPSSGFVASFTSADASSTVESLITNQWIDAKTRLVFLAFAVYNLEMQFFVLSDVALEILSNGATVSHYSSGAITPNRYDMGSMSGLIRIGMLAVVFLLVIYYAFDELDSCRRNGLKKYREAGWGYVDLANLLLFLLFGVLKLANYISYQVMIYQKSSYDSLLSKLRSLGKSYYIEDQVAGLIAFLLWFKLLKYIPVHKNLLLYTRALEQGFNEFVALGAIFCPLWFGYGIMGYMMFGESSEQFSSITRSCQSLILGMYGHLDFNKLHDELDDPGIAFVMVWVFMSTSTFFNVTIAFMIEALKLVASDEVTLRTETVMDKIKELIEKREAEFKQYRKHAEKERKHKSSRKTRGRSFFSCFSKSQVANEDIEEVEEVEAEEKEEIEELDEMEKEANRRKSSVVDDDWNPWSPPE